MKFFKHFADSHRGKSLKKVRRELGVTGIGMWWILVELCAEKLDKERDEEFTKAHCVFEFECGYLCQELGTNRRGIGQVLGTFAEHSLISSDISDNVCRIEMPKLLECLDRDSARARPERGHGAPKIKKKIKSIDGAFLNWRKEAVNVRVAMKKYGNWADSEAEVRHDLGDVVYDVAIRAGVHRMRMLPDNEFTTIAIAGLLKDAHQQTQLKLDQPPPGARQQLSVIKTQLEELA